MITGNTSPHRADYKLLVITSFPFLLAAGTHNVTHIWLILQMGFKLINALHYSESHYSFNTLVFSIQLGILLLHYFALMIKLMECEYELSLSACVALMCSVRRAVVRVSQKHRPAPPSALTLPVCAAAAGPPIEVGSLKDKSLLHSR